MGSGTGTVKPQFRTTKFKSCNTQVKSQRVTATSKAQEAGAATRCPSPELLLQPAWPGTARSSLSSTVLQSQQLQSKGTASTHGRMPWARATKESRGIAMTLDILCLLLTCSLLPFLVKSLQGRLINLIFQRQLQS